MKARDNLLAIAALLAPASAGFGQHPGMPRPNGPFAPPQPTTGLRGYQPPRRQDEEDQRRPRVAAEAGKQAGHLFAGRHNRHNPPRLQPPPKVGAPALSPPLVKSGGSWLGRTGSSAWKWLAGAAAALAAALGRSSARAGTARPKPKRRTIHVRD